MLIVLLLSNVNVVYKYVSASGTYDTHIYMYLMLYIELINCVKSYLKLDLFWLAAGFIGAQRVFTCVDIAVRLWTVV